MKLILIWIRRAIRAVFCRHQWKFLATVKDQHLRYGYDHWSDVFVCEKCGRHETRELTKR